MGRTVHESSPVGSSQSNGLIERAIQDVEGRARTMKLAFESHLGEKTPSDHNIVPWLVEYAAVLLNRGQVGQVGKIAYERLKGKTAKHLGDAVRREAALEDEHPGEGSEESYGCPDIGRSLSWAADGVG